MQWLMHVAQFTIPSTDPQGNRVIPLIPLTQVQLGQILTLVFITIGGVASLFLLIGAIRYVGSDGDPGKIKQARDAILYGVIGLVISLSAFTIVQFAIGVPG